MRTVGLPKISFYCRMLGISRQGFYKYLKLKIVPGSNKTWRCHERNRQRDECNDTYGFDSDVSGTVPEVPEGVSIPSERIVAPGHGPNCLSHRPKRRPNGTAKGRPGGYEIRCLVETGFPFRCPIRKMYYRYHGNPGVQWETVAVSVIFDCFDLSVLVWQWKQT